ncbi:MAG: SMC family ATPase, partial [Candidatus Methanoperedens sp.]|nr:SMC family ATPase [Candidatus Methanoperedens sp.]
MLIRSVELKNIKSYSHATIEFKVGINGICGQNGDGKTTILEAIGYVLFDYLPYSEKDFKRRGENSAYVTVELTANGEEYRLTRKLGGEFTIIGKGVNIAGKKDAFAWLSGNLFPLSNPEELPGIFENAVGVPQGMFTAAFMNPPAKRQKIFDEVMKVEEYRKAYDNLRDTMALIEKDINSIENDISGLRIRTERYGEKTSERDRLNVNIEDLRKGMKESSEKLNIIKASLEAQRKQKEELDRLKNEVIRLGAKLEGQNQQLKKATEEYIRSEQAQKIVSDLSGMKEKYEEARKNLEKFDELRKMRESVVQKMNRNQNELSLLLDKKKRIDLLKVEIEKKTVEKNALVPSISEQIDLEKKIDGKNQEQAIAMKEIKDVKSRMDIVGSKNICPVIKGVACNSVSDFSTYFKEQLAGAHSALEACQSSLKTLESELKAIGDPRAKMNGLEILIKNRTEEVAALDLEIKNIPEKENAASTIKSAMEKFSTLDSDMTEAKQKIRELEPLYQKYIQNLSLAARIMEHKNECERLKNSIAESEGILSEVNIRETEMRNSFNEKDLERTHISYEERGARVKGFQVEIKEKEGQLQKLNRDIIEMEKFLADIAGLEIKLENEKRFRDYSKFVRETLRDSGQHIVSELIGEISGEANNLYCSIMDDFSQELRWSEDYMIKIIDSGEEKIFQQLSGGEKMGAALAVRLALLKIISSSDFVFLDEPTQNMDEIRREKLSEQIMNIRGFKQ